MIGKVNKNATGSYQFTDDLWAAAKSEHYYYRLKMVGRDGGDKYSNTVVLDAVNNAESRVALYPNPVSRGASIIINGFTNSPVTVSMFNSIGQHIDSKQSAGSAGNLIIDIPVDWTTGLYIFRIADRTGNVITRRVLVR